MEEVIRQFTNSLSDAPQHVIILMLLGGIVLIVVIGALVHEIYKFGLETYYFITGGKERVRQERRRSNRKVKSRSRQSNPVGTRNRVTVAARNNR
jgi:hypothetical protein